MDASATRERGFGRAFFVPRERPPSSSLAYAEKSTAARQSGQPGAALAWCRSATVRFPPAELHREDSSHCSSSPHALASSNNGNRSKTPRQSWPTLREHFETDEGFLGFRHPPAQAATRLPPAGPALPDPADRRLHDVADRGHARARLDVAF